MGKQVAPAVGDTYVPGNDPQATSFSPDSYDAGQVAQQAALQQFANGTAGQGMSSAAPSNSDIHANLPSFDWGQMAANPKGYLKQRGISMLNNQIGDLYNKAFGPSDSGMMSTPEPTEEIPDATATEGATDAALGGTSAIAPLAADDSMWADLL